MTFPNPSAGVRIAAGSKACPFLIQKEGRLACLRV
jgi:hypothetical protein